VNWNKGLSMERFEELRQVAKEVARKLTGRHEAEELVKGIEKAQTLMGIKRTFEARGFKTEFEDMMIEFFK